MKIAFATQDLVRVDAHFGWARNLMVYDLTPEGHTFVETFTFGGDLQEDGDEDKLGPKIEAIKDCALLYVAAIGGSAAARIVVNKIHPVKLKDPEPILEVLEKMRVVLNGTPPPWLRKALLKGQERQFDFDEETQNA
jgi:nitrogen fixation protein NifX